METFGGIIVVISIVWSILCIILFFKIWKMCNDVSNILQFLVEKEYWEKRKRNPQDVLQKDEEMKND